MLRTLATLATTSAIVMTAALPTAASTAQSTAIDDFATSTNNAAYQQPVTFTGTLVDPRTNDPVAGEPVLIQFRPPGQIQYVPLATGTTGPDGHFTISTTLPSGGFVTAAFAGDGDLAPSQSSYLLLQVTHVPSRLLLDPVPSSVPAGTPVTFSGTMQVQVNGDWQAFPDAPLELTMEPGTSSRSNATYATTSDADGRFSLTEPVSQTSRWTVDTAVGGIYRGEWYPNFADAGYGNVYGVSKTRITGFHLPSHDEAHHAYYSGMYATGTVQRWDGTSWVGLPYGQVQFYYRPKGSTTWHKDYGTQTDAGGSFRNIVGVHLGTADWQARVRPAVDTLTATSTDVTNTITDKTYFRTISISRRSSASYINGQVTDWTKTQPASFSTLRGVKLRLYYRARYSKTWHYYRTTTAGTNGYFHFTSSKSRGYYFKVVLPAQGAYQTSTSRTL